MTEARYLYCIANSNKKIILGKIGLENNEVYTIPFNDICALVHDCPSEAYKSEIKEKVEAWVVTHEKVVEAAWGRFGTILPFGFDTIIRGSLNRNANDNIKIWLKDEYTSLKQKLDKLRAKAEYGIQIFWDPKIIGKTIAKTDLEIKKLNEDIKSKSKGLAYMYKQKLESLMRRQIEGEAMKYSRDFFDQIRRCVDEIKVEKTKKSEGDNQMLLNLSCLVLQEKSKVLGEELEKINIREEFSVRFTGPWPPYSFV